MPTIVYHHKDLDDAQKEKRDKWSKGEENFFAGRRLGGVSTAVMRDESGLTNMEKDAKELKPTKRDSVQAYNVLRDALFTKHSRMWKFRRGEAAASVALADVTEACGKAKLDHAVVNGVVQAVEKACAGALKEVTDEMNPDGVITRVNLAAVGAIRSCEKTVNDEQTLLDLTNAVAKEKVDEIIPSACRLHLRSFDEFGSLGKMVGSRVPRTFFGCYILCRVRRGHGKLFGHGKDFERARTHRSEDGDEDV
jgi:hypothetical protein